MKFILYCLLPLVIFSTKVDSDTWSKKLKIKIHKVVKHTYQIDQFDLNEITIKPADEKNTKSFITHNLFKVLYKDQNKGYIYVSQAASMKNVFDYIVLFDTKFDIVNTKVLIYREQHGRQIGSKRWLSQFSGLSLNDRPKIDQQIDGISGATISATNFTSAINDLLSSITFLKSKKILYD